MLSVLRGSLHSYARSRAHKWHLRLQVAQHAGTT